MPFLRGATNQISQPIFDTVLITTPWTSAQFFVVPRDQTQNTLLKTRAHTNLVQAGRLEAGVSFKATHISMCVREHSTTATDADIRALNRGSLTLFLGQVEFFTIPICQVPGGGAELNLFSNIAAAATEFKINKGVEHVSNRYPLDMPLIIEPQESIQVTLQDFTLVANTLVTIFLHGVYDRPVR